MARYGLVHEAGKSPLLDIAADDLRHYFYEATGPQFYQTQNQELRKRE